VKFCIGCFLSNKIRIWLKSDKNIKNVILRGGLGKFSCCRRHKIVTKALSWSEMQRGCYDRRGGTNIPRTGHHVTSHVRGLCSLLSSHLRLRKHMIFNTFRKVRSVRGKELLNPRPTPKMITPCQLSAAVYSIHSQLLSISSIRGLWTHHVAMPGTHLYRIH
jgi:hypothetical protein